MKSSTGPSGASNRRQPVRQARTTTTRPSNYFARPLSYKNQPASVPENAQSSSNAPGFCPAITYFTDSMSALPKEVMRHFTMLCETEGKAYHHDQAIGNLLDKVEHLTAQPEANQAPQLQDGSQHAALIHTNESALEPQISSPFKIHEAPMTQSNEIPEHQRQKLFLQLESQLRDIAGVLDEKNMVLSKANDTLSRQLSRLDSSLPHVENEVSEEARLGSNTHWALPHMKELRRANAGHNNDRSKRDVQAANSLAAAATAVHEHDIAATRSEARREAMFAKRNRAYHFDAEVDERPVPKKQHTTAKPRKGEQASESKRSVDQTSSGQVQKKRRVEKATATSNERSLSAALNGRLGPGRPSPRDSLTAEAGRKKAKQATGTTAARRK